MASASSVGEEAEETGWLEALFREHYGAVVRWTRALGVPAAACEDVAQQVFLIAGRRRTEVVASGRPRAFLFGVARRASANARRSHRRERARRERAEPPVAFAEPEQALARAEAAALLESLLARLSERHREVFVLTEIEGLGAPEVAEILELEPKTVHARLRTARKHMARLVEQQRARQTRQTRQTRERSRR